MAKKECQIQTEFVKWLRLYHPNTLFTISPAGMIMSPGMAMKINRMGYTKGTPDIMIFAPRAEYHGLFIEFKTMTGVLSPEQKNFLLGLTILGYRTHVCRDASKAAEITQKYLDLPHKTMS